MKRRLISIPFFLLRTTTAGAALVTGLLQTYVFAHILSPQRFSIFILVAAFGYSLWLIDFGIVKILFVRLRARFLAGDQSDAVAGHATAVVLFYFALVTTGALLCFVFMAAHAGASLRDAAEFGLFFWFVALNLVWFALRNIAIAVDEYVLFEALETVRRAGYFVGLAAVLFGLPLIVMLIALNALWAVVVAACVRRMIARGALRPHIGGFVADFVSFFRANKAQLVRSGAYAGSEIYTANYPYLIVPMLFGLGAPPIILDTTFKVFRGGATIFGAVCDILVPRQTSALAERDGPTLVRATLTAAALCSIPAAIACLILYFGADKLFHLLLGNAATMPPATTPILIVLLIANLTQMVCHSVLVHNGYFREVARIGMAVMTAMTGVGAYAVLAHIDIVQFLEAYVAVYTCGAVAAVVLMIRGPIRLAHEIAAVPGAAPRKLSDGKAAPATR
jgi:O-antigen/teichoic acid export membrane protein